MISIKKKICQMTIGVVSLSLTAAVNTVIAQEGSAEHGMAVYTSGNKITGGNEVVQRVSLDSRNNFFLVDTNKPFSAEADITWWEIWVINLLPVELVIYRKTDNSWSVVGRSKVETPTKRGVNRFTLASAIRVQAGDFVGLYYPKTGSVSFNKDSGAWDLGNLTGTVLFTKSGANPTVFSGSSYRTYSVSAGGNTTGCIEKNTLVDNNTLTMCPTGTIMVGIAGGWGHSSVYNKPHRIRCCSSSDILASTCANTETEKAKKELQAKLAETEEALEKALKDLMAEKKAKEGAQTK